MFPLIKNGGYSDETRSGYINSAVINWCIYTFVSFILDLFKSKVILNFGLKTF